MERMRASIVVLGPLLTRCGHARVSMPGGDDFGNRPIDIHLNGLGAMGARFETVHGYVEGRVGDGEGAARLVGNRVVLEYPSHTATDNLLMAAVLAKGTTVIENAAREPEISDMATFLNSMGASVRGAGTSRIEVEGTDELHPARHTVILTGWWRRPTSPPSAWPEARWWSKTPGLITWRCCCASSAPSVFGSSRPPRTAAAMTGPLHSADVATLPFPGVATDYKPLLVTMLSVADGVGIVTENLFFGRFRYVDELRRMGADIRTEGHHAVVRGVPRLSVPRSGRQTSGPGRRWCWLGSWPRVRRKSPTPATSTGAMKT